MKTVHLREGSWIAAIAALKLRSRQAAIVTGRTIHLYNIGSEAFLNNERWVRHELKHVEQYEQYGFVRFIIMYLWATLKDGYYNNRFEQEARSAEQDEYLRSRHNISANIS